MPIPYDYQIVEDAPDTDDRLTDLSLLGVSLGEQSDGPTAEGFPSKFNPEARDVWEKMFLTEEWKTQMHGHTIDGQWHASVLLFLEMCQDYGVAPFDHTTSNVKNEYVASAVRSARIHLVRYLDRTRIFEKLKVRTAFREYIRTDDGIVIHSWALMDPYKMENRPQFQNWLLGLAGLGGPRFLRYIDNHFVKIITPQLQIYVKCFNMNRIVLGFTINISGSVVVPGDKTPTRKEVDQFIDRTILIPTLRSYRLDNVWNRLF